jgi:hypothetical protein
MPQVLKCLEKLQKLPSVNADLVAVVPMHGCKLTVGNRAERFTEKGLEVFRIEWE